MPRTSFPKEKIKVVLLENIHPKAAALLRSEGFGVETLTGAAEGAKLLKLVEGAHVLGIRSKTQLTPEVLGAAKRLLAIGCFCIGTDQVHLGAARGAGVPVFNAPFCNTRSVAELTIAEAIALTRQLVVKSEQMHKGVWDKSASGAHEVRGRTLGIVGYGHIGSQVSVLAEALGMRVIYFDIVPKLAIGNARSVRTLAELLKESDVVTLHVPSNASTKNMFGAKQFAMMKQGACFINNARGGVVDVDSLVASLRSKHLGGAALDVFPDEPSSSEQEFVSAVRGVPNVILTPHIGGSTEEAQEAIGLDVAEKLLKFVNVGTTTGAVNVPEVELPEQEQRDASETPRAARRHRVLHFHRNVPGVLSTMHQRIAQLGANISAEFLRTSEDIGYVVLDVDPTDGDRVLEAVRTIPETIRCRVLW
jgi:D-3-phosphoglycerate dehydrogenase